MFAKTDLMARVLLTSAAAAAIAAAPVAYGALTGPGGAVATVPGAAAAAGPGG